MPGIKVQCGCGQRYAFDVEPVGGRMPFPVACPVCGADGTSAANELISNSVQSVEVAASTPAVGIRLRAPATAPTVHVASPAAQPPGRPARLLPGQLDRSQAELEARAKIFWGDAPEEVVKFLMRQNIPHQEASNLVSGMFDERAAAIRSNGIGKIISGSGMLCVPIVAWFIFNNIGVIPIKLFALTVMVGLWGAWRILKGTIMVVSPRSEAGDVADQ